MFALEGIDPRQWTPADRCAVSFLLLKRAYRSAGDMAGLRNLYELVEDREALAALDREIMGQGRQVEVTNG